jgi:hypothetical protein
MCIFWIELHAKFILSDRYKAEDMSFDSVLLDSPHLGFEMYRAVSLTKWVWMDKNTFVLPISSTKPISLKLQYITLFPDNSYSVSTRCIDELRNFVTSQNGPQYFQNFFGNFFVFPKLPEDDKHPQYYYFISHCPKHFNHSRLLFVSRTTLKIVRYLDLPGYIGDVCLDPRSKEIFVLLGTSPDRFYTPAYADAGTYPPNPKKFHELKCYLEDPWISKREGTSFVENLIFKVDELGLKWNTSKCLRTKTYPPAGYEKATNNQHTIYYRNLTAYSTSQIHLSKYFVTALDDAIKIGVDISRYHHYHAKVAKGLLGMGKIFRHPTKPVSLALTPGKQGFTIYMDEWAESEDRKALPTINFRRNKFHFKTGPVNYSCVINE